MRILNIFLSVSICLLSLIACNDDSNRITLNDGDFVSPTWQREIKQNFVVNTTTNQSDSIGWASWTEAKFGVESPVTYAIVADTTDSFKTEVIVDRFTEFGSKKAITIKMLNNAASKFITESKPVKLHLALKSFLGTAGSRSALYTDSYAVSFTAYYMVYPTTMYMIGDEFGNWDWGSADVAEMTPVNEAEGTFWCIRYFDKDKGFKWSPEKAWGKDFYQLTTNEGFTIKDKNAFVPANGIYRVFIDLPKKKLTIEPAKVYGIGDSFGDPGAEQNPFAVDANGKTMSAKTTKAGELRLYAGMPGTIDWWRTEFIILDGKIVYRGNGGNQLRVNVVAGNTVTLDFNKGTGTIK